VAGKKQRQRKLARERHERRLARQAQRDRRLRVWSIAVVAAIVVVGGTVGGIVFAGRSTGTPSTASTPKASATPTPSPTASTVAEPATHCTYVANPPAARKVNFPPATPDYKASYQATITTNRGPIVIDLLNSKATCTVNSFVSLADQAFYNNTPCPRLSTSSGVYMLQCGDPTGKGTGGPGYGFASENLTGATYPAGTVAMANATGVPDSNGSQFFLVYQDSSLPPDYTPFGKIVTGLNILQNVGKRGYGPPLSEAGGGAPKESVEIESVTIKQT
jgi:peptidyl-prolyl cis-trans isomerase B (cyclophilin B)